MQSSEKAPEKSPAEPARGRTFNAPALIAGLLLFLLALVVTAAIEGQPGEFGYFPFAVDPLPFAPMRGFTLEQLVAHVAAITLATPALLLIWWSLKKGQMELTLTAAQLERLALYTSCFSVAMIAFVMFAILRGRAIMDDELAYRFQASLLAQGKLGLQGLPPLREFFAISTNQGTTAKYMFGEPLLQVPGLLLGNPALLHIPVAALTLWALYRAASLLADRQLAAWSTIVVALSPMFILTSATGLSQAAGFGCIVLASLGYAWVLHGRVLRGAALVGMAVGYCASARLQVAVPAGGAVGVMTLIALVRQKNVGGVAMLVLTAGIWLAAILAYNYALSGSPFTLPWFLEDVPEHFGFGQVWSSNTFEHTPLIALENLFVVLVRLNAWWLGWPSSLLMLYFWYRLGCPRTGARLWLIVGLCVILFEAGYYSTGVSDTGAIYHYELLLPGAILAANTIVRGLEREPRSMSTLLLVQFGLGLSTFLYFQTARLERLVSYIHDDVDAALSEVKPPAILFYEPLCQESISRAWVHERFPKRYRLDSDPIVTFSRPMPGKIQAYLDRYPGRQCWYFHFDPTQAKYQALPCRKALPELNRTIYNKDSDKCLWIPSTATEMGLFDPFSAGKARQIRRHGVETNQDQPQRWAK